MIEFVPLDYSLLKSVCEIEAACIETPWGYNAMEKEIHNDNAVYFCAIKDNITVGYIGLWNICGEGNITNVAVHNNFRRQGIGKSLIKKMIEYAKNKEFLFLTLEVNENNIAAYNMYKKCGFYETGRRKKYYHNKYDAILMNFDI